MWFVPYELKKTNKFVSELGQLLKTEEKRGTGEMVRQSQAPATKPGNLDSISRAHCGTHTNSKYMLKKMKEE